MSAWNEVAVLRVLRNMYRDIQWGFCAVFLPGRNQAIMMQQILEAEKRNILLPGKTELTIVGNHLCNFKGEQERIEHVGEMPEEMSFRWRCPECLSYWYLKWSDRSGWYQSRNSRSSDSWRKAQRQKMEKHLDG